MKESVSKQYIAIDLKSFYASVECTDRGLDPLRTHLVVADPTRTDKTICLAVSPSLKSYGIPGRPRLFEVVQRVRELNAWRADAVRGHKLTGSSHFPDELEADPSLAIDYIVAPPRMRRYMEVSTHIFDIYLKYVSEEDVHVYSVDEVFIDATPYLRAYGTTAHELAIRMIRDVLKDTGITATAGIGTNMYLAKIAMDIVAKHMPPDEDGVRLAELDEMSYRRQLWDHTPITDFWRVGGGIARRLARYGIYTMGDIARCSVGRPEDFYNEELLYKQFGVNAELLIDHAWGWEPCEIRDIKAFRPENNSLSQGQVLSQPYTPDKARIVVREMTEMLSLDLVVKKVMTDQMVLTVCYDRESLADPALAAVYKGEISTDRYGRRVPKDAHGSINLGGFTSSTRQMAEAVWELFDRIVDRRLLVRRMYVVANHITREKDVEKRPEVKQLNLFEDFDIEEGRRQEREEQRRREHALQEAVISIKNKYGKNAIIKGTNLEEGATGMERNRQVGGHKA